jgi:hypothetical protein
VKALVLVLLALTSGTAAAADSSTSTPGQPIVLTGDMLRAANIASTTLLQMIQRSNKRPDQYVMSIEAWKIEIVPTPTTFVITISPRTDMDSDVVTGGATIFTIDKGTLKVVDEKQVW